MTYDAILVPAFFYDRITHRRRFHYGFRESVGSYKPYLVEKQRVSGVFLFCSVSCHINSLFKERAKHLLSCGLTVTSITGPVVNKVLFNWDVCSTQHACVRHTYALTRQLMKIVHRRLHALHTKLTFYLKLCRTQIVLLNVSHDGLIELTVPKIIRGHLTCVLTFSVFSTHTDICP